MPVILEAGTPTETSMEEKEDRDSFAKSYIEAKKDSYKLFNKTEVSEKSANDRWTNIFQMLVSQNKAINCISSALSRLKTHNSVFI